MNARDLEYIQNRLVAPAGPASEAYDRLQEAGEDALAGALMAAMQEFTDACRTVRYALDDKLAAARRAS